MSKEYDEYLKQHRENVAKGYYWLVENLPDIAAWVDTRQICAAHDKSKSNEDEYYAYDEYFYGKDQSFETKDRFNKAWLKHIHRNPHHWQYWILNNDDGAQEILDIDYNYIIEMVCDWWSFCWKDGKLFEIFNWFNEHKSYIKLSDKTRFMVEDILKRMHNKLTENGGM